MVTAGDAIRTGDLSGALAAATAAVKAAPANADARWLLAELLLVSGDAERADRMLDAAVLHEPNPAVLEFRMLLRADVVRSQAVREGRAPKYQGDDATPAQQAALRARMLLRSGDVQGAVSAAAEVETLRPRVPGRVERADGISSDYEDLRDVDDLLAAEFEVLTTAGDYMLVPTERVRSLVFDTPRRTRDLVWRRCEIDLKDGTAGVVYMPAIYMGPQPESDDALRLGRITDWTDPENGPVQGRGQRLLLAGDEALAFTAIRSVVLD